MTVRQPAAPGTGPFGTHVDGVVVEVQVVPNASRQGIVGLHGDRLRVRVSAAPEDGRANRAVAAELASFFGVRVDLLSGGRSRVKRYLLRGLTLAAARARMRRLSP